MYVMTTLDLIVQPTGACSSLNGRILNDEFNDLHIRPNEKTIYSVLKNLGERLVHVLEIVEVFSWKMSGCLLWMTTELFR